MIVSNASEITALEFIGLLAQVVAALDLATKLHLHPPSNSSSGYNTRALIKVLQVRSQGVERVKTKSEWTH